MARVVKEYDERRAEILAVAQRLFYQKGYEPTSVQEIINEVGIAKGTFYHYFSSKIDLLDVIIAQMTERILQGVMSIVEDESLSAPQKFEAFFVQGLGLKLQEKDFLIKILPTWYSDDNTLWREKTKQASLEHVTGMLERIIRQGVDEGVFSTLYPYETAEIMMQMNLLLSDAVGKTLLEAKHPEDEKIVALERRVKANRVAVENLLNAPPDSVKLYDFEQIKQWFG